MGVFLIGYADAQAAPLPHEESAVERAEREAERARVAREEAARAAARATETAEREHEAHDEPEPAPRVPPPTRPEYGQLDRDGDHIVDAEDQCVLDREDFDEIADVDGCPEEDADGDAIADLEDQCPMTPGVASDDAEMRGCPERAFVSDTGSIVIRERVEFATGSDRILPASEPVLQDVLAIIQSTDSVRVVRIEGHTDDRGRDPANLRLSRARAASVRRWLVERGVDAARLTAFGCGELHPLVPNRTRADRQTNRRVEFLIVDPMPAELTLREGCEEEP